MAERMGFDIQYSQREYQLFLKTLNKLVDNHLKGD